MTQRTCNIIVLCKGNGKYWDGADTCIEAIVSYMSNSCGIPKKAFDGSFIEIIMREALFDYISNSDNPDKDLHGLFYPYVHTDVPLIERICMMFCSVDVSKFISDVQCVNVNGFTEELLSQSEKDLSFKWR